MQGKAEKRRSREAKKQTGKEARKPRSKEAQKQRSTKAGKRRQAGKLGTRKPQNPKTGKKYVYIYIALQVFGGPALCLYCHAMTLNCHTDLAVRVNGIIPAT
jgi:hypothetical protein